jgi:hypothetical protein
VENVIILNLELFKFRNKMKETFTEKEIDEMEVITFPNLCEFEYRTVSQRQVLFHKDKNKVFIPVFLIGEKGFYCAAFDGEPFIYYDETDTEFIDSDWVIKEKMLDDEMIAALKRLKERLKNEMD